MKSDQQIFVEHAEFFSRKALEFTEHGHFDCTQRALEVSRICYRIASEKRRATAKRGRPRLKS